VPGTAEETFDAIIVGGGPAGATMGWFLADRGHRVLLLERDIHPRDHVGESLTPSTNVVFDRMGFLPKMEEAGFVHKPGACWTSPRAPIDRHLSLRLAEYPPPDAVQPYTYNVERDEMDALLLRHAHEKGVPVLQGVGVREVLFEDGRAVGVRAQVLDGWERVLRARVVVDASGRRCLLANQLRLKRKDPWFNQFSIYSWFRDVEPSPPGFEGFLFLHFLGLQRAWAWQIPLRWGTWSVGVVTERSDFTASGRPREEFFSALVSRNRNLTHRMRRARRVRPWRVEGDYSYSAERATGPGWILLGDALRFVDPIFSSGVDVAVYSAALAADAVHETLSGGDEGAAFERYERSVGDGIQLWYELTDLFYRLQNLFSRFAVTRRHREDVIRILQGNLYVPDTQERARRMLAVMRESYEAAERDPENLLRPGALVRG
jgi:1H-pyrrole-2-carbonyl-[peptidyl-carrier protein] chlorinase